MTITIYLFVALLFYFCYWIILNYDELHKSFGYKCVLKHLYKAIQYTERDIKVATCGINLPDDNWNDSDEKSEFINKMVTISKDSMMKLDKTYKTIMFGIKSNPTQYDFIYMKMYEKCISNADNLRDLFCENFSRFY